MIYVVLCAVSPFMDENLINHLIQSRRDLKYFKDSA